MGYTVYLHTFPNGKYYVGITSQEISRRWRDGQGYIGQPVYNAILKYGWENIRHDILKENLTLEEAEEEERRLITKYNSLSHDNGYNVENGGNCTKHLSKETKAKISKAKKGKCGETNHWNYGKHLSEETKKKIAKAHTGKKQSEETKRKKSELFSGENNPMYGSKIPKEHKKKLQEACVKATSKAVKCIETDTVYQSASEAQRMTGVDAGTIRNVCKKDPRYKRAGGFHWEYAKSS